MSPAGGRHTVTVLDGRTSECLSKDELSSLLARPLVMDWRALRRAEALGLGRYCGTRLAGTVAENAVERFTGDPLNEPYCGELRDGKLSLMAGEVGLLEPLDRHTRRLTQIEGYDGAVLGSGLTLCENDLGGRVAVMGYAPYSHYHSSARMYQLKQMIDWVSAGRLTLRVMSEAKIVASIRVSEDRRHFLLSLVNGGFDPVTDLEVSIRLNAEGRPFELDRGGGRRELDASSEIRRTPEELRIRIGRLAMWEHRIIVC
jgi:hypothetical protein